MPKVKDLLGKEARRKLARLKARLKKAELKHKPKYKEILFEESMNIRTHLKIWSGSLVIE